MWRSVCRKRGGNNGVDKVEEVEIVCVYVWL